MKKGPFQETMEPYSACEQANIELVKEFMLIAYSPREASANAVAHLCAPGNRMIAPTTFPGVNTLEEYVEAHSALMREINDLHITSFDVFFSKGDSVCLRYSAEGSHRGAPHGRLAPTGKTARWTACAIFRVVDGKLVEFIKEWDKLSMWEQLGWPVEECSVYRGHAASVR
ncbi:MAG TPA: ester cyclase [Bryobacteraceae bacterium]|jgi:predicted ester cyclase|nr:ester cyclase [Bryobacteraceae bacterium]